jgi:glycosyltransferase involved in cell wall biosynthesis
MRVTVGIPFKNAESTLPLAIKSVFAQSFGDWELILLDDGSTDGSLDIARSIVDPRVRTLSDGKNLGLAARLNQITELARGDVIVRMDADDAMHPERIERQLTVLDAHPIVDLVACHAYAIDGDGRVYGLKGTGEIVPDPKLFLQNAVIVHPTVTARRQWMLRNQYDPHLRKSQDKELFARTHTSSTFRKVPEPLLFYRELGTFSLQSYRDTARMDRLIFRMYGPDRIGELQTLRALAMSYVKVFLYTTLCVVGASDRLVRRRVDGLPESERIAAAAVLRKVGQTAVPGLT